MKKKKIATTLLAGVMMISAVGISTVAYGASNEKTATLNNAQVRFNGGSVQTIQCYNIEGYNFVRARDVTNNLDMAVMAIQNGNTGVMVDPLSKPTSKVAPEKLTQKSAKVKVEKGQLIYDGMVSEAECFLLNGRYYFKLSDFAKAAEYTLNISLENIEIEARGDFVDEPFIDTFSSISVEWNNDTKVIDVNRVENDLRKVFDDIRGSKTTTTKPEKEEVVEKEEEKKTEDKTPTSNLNESQYAEEVLRLVNEEREKNGVAPLKMDATLVEAANIRAKETATLFSHTRPNGEKWKTALDEVGFYNDYVGENIAGAAQSPQSVVKAWMDSEGHRNNILREEYTRIGIGYSYVDGRIASWVQIFSD